MSRFWISSKVGFSLVVWVPVSLFGISKIHSQKCYVTFSRHVTVLGYTGTVITFNTVEGKAHASFCREPFPHAPVVSQQC